MHENKATTETQGAKGSQRIAQQQHRINRNNSTSVATGCVSIWELPTRLNTRYHAKHDPTRCCTTHEMWELPTPLIVANRSQQGDEVRELPAQPQQHPGTHRDQQQQGKLNRI
ncbi:ABC transporter C family member 13 [Dorcoceras hygrometricum]|uniref:ABC transporter C family member 13 n=1 Tax=Dorcoceras hygrometricum TaxID=472368 RepID=A0A2Z7AKV7_9LAMI|nr:ABC transporter C family member 13 [Dorcoceras hygrometricum]